ncbi:hypothetical protein RRG08_052892 [Elysia crispata]|uniref:Uncharacterized protein n=1 Tax=Elysia crispata TaxID=231223 RepID=A0AAE0ZE56_9GAST|nr:hypothetical protein RRG08_052892 [Elysia crispata]
MKLRHTSRRWLYRTGHLRLLVNVFLGTEEHIKLVGSIPTRGFEGSRRLTVSNFCSRRLTVSNFCSNGGLVSSLTSAVRGYPVCFTGDLLGRIEAFAAPIALPRQVAVSAETSPGAVFVEKRPGTVLAETRPGAVLANTRSGTVLVETRQAETKQDTVLAKPRPGAVLAETRPSTVLTETRPSTVCLSRDKTRHCLRRGKTWHCLNRDKTKYCLRETTTVNVSEKIRVNAVGQYKTKSLIIPRWRRCWQNLDPRGTLRFCLATFPATLAVG